MGHFDDFEYFKNSLIHMALIFTGESMFFRILRIFHHNNQKSIYSESEHFKEKITSIYDEPKFLFVASLKCSGANGLDCLLSSLEEPHGRSSKRQIKCPKDSTAMFLSKNHDPLTPLVTHTPGWQGLLSPCITTQMETCVWLAVDGRN